MNTDLFEESVNWKEVADEQQAKRSSPAIKDNDEEPDNESDMKGLESILSNGNEIDSISVDIESKSAKINSSTGLTEEDKCQRSVLESSTILAVKSDANDEYSETSVDPASEQQNQITDSRETSVKALIEVNRTEPVACSVTDETRRNIYESIDASLNGENNEENQLGAPDTSTLTESTDEPEESPEESPEDESPYQEDKKDDDYHESSDTEVENNDADDDADSGLEGSDTLTKEEKSLSCNIRTRRKSARLKTSVLRTISDDTSASDSPKQRLSEGSAEHECDICGRLFRYKRHYVQHRRRCEKAPDDMEEASPAKITLEIDSVVTSKPELRPHECSRCGGIFKTRSKLRLHRKMCVKPKPDLMNKKPRPRSERRPLESSHYKCEICECLFRYKSHYTQHLRACEKAQNQLSKVLVEKLSSDIDSISSSEHGQNFYECMNCGRVLRAKDELQLHQQACVKPDFEVETDIDGANTLESGGNESEKRTTIACYFCDENFQDQIALNDHIFYRHNNIKPFICEECEVRFVQRIQWQEHTKLNHNFECAKCKEYKFVKEEELRMHEEKCTTVAKVKQEITTSLLRLSVVTNVDEIAECQSDRNAYVPQKVKRETKKVQLKCELDSGEMSTYSDSEPEIDSSSDYEPPEKKVKKSKTKLKEKTKPKEKLKPKENPKPKEKTQMNWEKTENAIEVKVVRARPKPKPEVDITKLNVKKEHLEPPPTMLVKPANQASLTHGCNICEALLPNKAALRNHLQMFHDYDYLFCCKTCRWGGVDSKYTSPQSHNCQTMEDHAYLRYPHENRCKICFAVYKTEERYHSHVKEHENKMLKCDVCGADCYGLEHRKRHIAQAHMRREVTYTSADGDVKKISVQRVSVESDKTSICLGAVRRLPVNMTCQCTDCNGIFSGFTRLKDHFISFHLHPNLYFCRHCRRGFSSKTKQELHKCDNDNLDERRKTAPEKCRCKTCDAIFETEDDFTSHSEAHKQRGARKISRIIKQSQLHKREQRLPCVCSECDAIFPGRVLLNQHYAQIHGYTSMHFCYQCSSGYQHNMAFKLHECIRTDVAKRLLMIPKERICRLCEAGFEIQVQFNDHIREHDSKPSLPYLVTAKSSSPKKVSPEKITVKIKQEPQETVVNQKEFPTTVSVLPQVMPITSPNLKANVPVLTPQQNGKSKTKPVRKALSESRPQDLQMPQLRNEESNELEPPVLTPVTMEPLQDQTLPPTGVAALSAMSPVLPPRRPPPLENPHLIPEPRKAASPTACAICEECSAIFPSRPALKLHHKNYHGFKIMIFCQTCHSGSHKTARHADCQLSELNYRRSIVPKEQVCTLCHAAFEDKEKFIEHCQAHESTKVHCKFCNKLFVDSYVLKRHVDRCHKNKLNDEEQTGDPQVVSNYNVSISEASAVVSMLGTRDNSVEDTCPTTSTDLDQLTSMTSPLQQVSSPLPKSDGLSHYRVPKLNKEKRSQKSEPARGYFTDYDQYLRKKYESVADSGKQNRRSAYERQPKSQEQSYSRTDLCSKSPYQSSEPASSEMYPQYNEKYNEPAPSSYHQAQPVETYNYQSGDYQNYLDDYSHGTSSDYSQNYNYQNVDNGYSQNGQEFQGQYQAYDQPTYHELQPFDSFQSGYLAPATSALTPMSTALTPLSTSQTPVTPSTWDASLVTQSLTSQEPTYVPTPLHLLNNGEQEEKTPTGIHMTSQPVTTSQYNFVGASSSFDAPVTSESLTFFQPFVNHELGIASSTQPIPGFGESTVVNEAQTVTQGPKTGMLPSDLLTMFKTKNSVRANTPPRTVKELLASKEVKAESSKVPYKKRAYEFSQARANQSRHQVTMASTADVPMSADVTPSSYTDDVMPSSLLNQFKSTLSNRKRSYEH